MDFLFITCNFIFYSDWTGSFIVVANISDINWLHGGYWDACLFYCHTPYQKEDRANRRR